MITDTIWGLLVVGGGALILGIAIAYGLLRQRRLRPEERARRDEATRDLYRGDE
jgi:hypothetical protein